MKIAIGSDHGGVDLKEVVVSHLKEKGIEVIDLGTHSKDSCDYPEYGEKVGQAVMAGESDQGIVICGTGLGISMAANKIPGIRAALCTNEFMAEMAKAHNNANVLALGARVLGEGLALRIVDVFLESSFEGERHARRVEGIGKIEKKYLK
ncbi:ribose 5-phosphate isomerase B [Eubacteriaceae bacterium ES3]|nr:ribose 5-phosphate isomerase B [Eubacteriaceae bacterium ES3]